MSYAQGGGNNITNYNRTNYTWTKRGWQQVSKYRLTNTERETEVLHNYPISETQFPINENAFHISEIEFQISETEFNTFKCAFHFN